MNINAQFKKLFNTRLDSIVHKEGEAKLLENTLVRANCNQPPLFVAAEQGSEQHEQNAYAVLNPKLKSNAREWIINIHKTISFRKKSDNKALINPMEFKRITRHNESLKEFLTLMILNKRASHMKNEVLI